jgi:hypothetical protein
MPSDSLLKAVVNLVSEYRIETLAANLGIMDVINDLDVVWRNSPYITKQGEVPR